MQQLYRSAAVPPWSVTHAVILIARSFIFLPCRGQEDECKTKGDFARPTEAMATGMSPTVPERSAKAAEGSRDQGTGPQSWPQKSAMRIDRAVVSEPRPHRANLFRSSVRKSR